MSQPNPIDDRAIAMSFPRGISSFEKLVAEISPHPPDSWLEDRFTETDVVAALPKFDENPWWCVILGLSSQEAAAESRLSRACAETGMLGINRSGFVAYRFFDHAVLEVSDCLIQELKASGWSDEHIRQVTNRGELTQIGDDIRHRMKGAAGWLICNANFCRGRDALRTQWLGLSSIHRHPLPLLRTAHLDHPPDGARRKSESKSLIFWQAFNQFCDVWRIKGMVTWRLPEPDGPKWTEHYPGRPQTLSGVDCFDTPWHFPLLKRDGLGEQSREFHRSRAAENNFHDQGNWETYAHLLEIDYWEHVVRSRYGPRKQSSGSIDKMIGVFSNLFHLDEQRIEKLRKVLSQFRRGKRTSLSSRR